MRNDIKRLILTFLVCAGIVGGVAYGADFFPFSGGLSTGTGGLKSLTSIEQSDGAVVILNSDATYGNAFFAFGLDEAGGCGTELAPVCIESGDVGQWWELTDVHGMNHYAWGTLPEFKLNDTDGVGTALADKHAGSLKANFTTATEDAEVSDIYLTAYLAGTETNAVFYDGSATALLVHGHVVPDTVNSYTAGTALLPFTSVFIGDAATNNVQLINTAAASAVVLTLPSTTGTLYGSGSGTITSAELLGSLTNETGSGVAVFGTSPTFTTSILPSAAGATAIGTTLLPFSSVFIGDEATNNVQLINTAAAGAVVLTLPSTTGTLMRTVDSPAAMVIASQAAGDLLYASSSSAWARLAVAGQPGYTLTSGTTAGGTAPLWQAPGAAGKVYRGAGTTTTPTWSTSTFADTYVQGGLLHAATANTIAALAPGAVGSFLMSNGASAALSYLAAGAANYQLVGAGVTTIPVWTASTGTGAPVLANTPTLITPVLGVATGTSIALGADPGDTANSAVMLSNAAVISWEDATEATITHVNDVGLKFNLPITLSNDESISNVDDTEITFVGTEAISLDLDTGTANVVEWKNRTTSTTGVTTMSFAALNLATTGTIQGGITIASDADGMDAAAMTAAGMYGTMFIATGNGTWILPRAALGMSACLMDSGTAHDLILDVTAGSTVRLKGTEQADGIGITQATQTTTGDFVCVIAVATDKWSTVGMSGTWVSQ